MRTVIIAVVGFSYMWFPNVVWLTLAVCVAPFAIAFAMRKYT